MNVMDRREKIGILRALKSIFWDDNAIYDLIDDDKKELAKLNSNKKEIKRLEDELYREKTGTNKLEYLKVKSGGNKDKLDNIKNSPKTNPHNKEQEEKDR